MPFRPSGRPSARGIASGFLIERTNTQSHGVLYIAKFVILILLLKNFSEAQSLTLTSISIKKYQFAIDVHINNNK